MGYRIINLFDIIWTYIYIVVLKLKVFFFKIWIMSKTKIQIAFIVQREHMRFRRARKKSIRKFRDLVVSWRDKGQPYLPEGTDPTQWLAMKMYHDMRVIQPHISVQEIAERLDLNDFDSSWEKIFYLAGERKYNLQTCPNCMRKVEPDFIKPCFVCKKSACKLCMISIGKVDPQSFERTIEMCHENCPLPTGFINPFSKKH